MPEGSHRFRGIHNADMLRQGLALEVTRTPEGVIAKLTNEGAGHALPTYITPRIRLLLHDQEWSKTAELVIQRSMDWHPDSGWRELFDTRLMPGESRRLTLPLEPNATARAEVVVEPDADYHDRVYPYLVANLQDEISATALAQLRTAHTAAASSHYIAYQVDCSAARDKSYRCGP